MPQSPDPTFIMTVRQGVSLWRDTVNHTPCVGVIVDCPKCGRAVNNDYTDNFGCAFYVPTVEAAVRALDGATPCHAPGKCARHSQEVTP